MTLFFKFFEARLKTLTETETRGLFRRHPPPRGSDLLELLFTLPRK